MAATGYTPWEWLVFVEHELLLFAAFFFALGALDELAIDLVWLRLRLAGRGRAGRLDFDPGAPPELQGRAAVFVPAWLEAGVIGATIGHAFAAWPQEQMRLYVGCYPNDEETIVAVIAAARGDPRLRLVVHDRAGPSTKADCLNRLYRALEVDEQRSGERARMIVLHDAEDMVDAAGLTLLDRAISEADLAQLPVLPVPQAASRWIAGHYCEEFAEAHGKAMVVRDELRAGLPSAGVGCALSRGILDRLARARGDGKPFAPECLTEDYELGLGISDLGGRARFLRFRHADDALVATRACFPADLGQAVRQKTRWVHGIAFQGWDRLGWTARPVEFWMRLRDRRGPLTALVLAAAYLLLLLATFLWVAQLAGTGAALKMSPLLTGLLWLNLASFCWRAVWRFAFTAREYGISEGLRAVLRIPVANVIAIMAGRRAVAAYARTLLGQAPRWDKTHHHDHPTRLEGGAPA